MIYVGKNEWENNEDCDDTNWGPIWEWNQCRLKIFWFVMLGGEIQSRLKIFSFVMLGGRNSIAVKNFLVCDVN